jgi:hypothetical protein
MYSHTEVFDLLLKSQAALTCLYLICAFVVFDNSFGGFNAGFLGCIYIGFTAATYYGIVKSITRTNFGIILGGATILLFVSLQSAIFWGQYGDCDKYSSRYLMSEDHVAISSLLLDMDNVSHRALSSGPEQCHRQSAMKAVCAFSVLMFLSYIVQIFSMLYFKNDMLGTGTYQEVSYSSISSTNSQRTGNMSVPSGTYHNLHQPVQPVFDPEQK